jgi:hypothetical protein
MRALLISVALLTLAAFAGCSQGVGDRCEIDSDCESGLFCSGSTGAQSMGGMGTCQPIGSGIAPPPPVDAGPDTGVDVAPASDGAADSATDTAPAVDGAADVSVPDALGVE